MKFNDVLFLTLKVYSATGGIEKVCRVAGKALYEQSVQGNTTFQLYSMHDSKMSLRNGRYFPTEFIRPFSGWRIRCILSSVKKGIGSRVVLMSHINLLLIGWLIKKISPQTHIALLTHGIEVWKPLNKFKHKMLCSCDEIIAVSHFTAEKLKEIHSIPESKISVLNNCLDPFLPLPGSELNNLQLRKRYGFEESDIVLFTLTRLATSERYKGYDQVIRSLVEIRKQYPAIRYLIAGKYDEEEKKHLDLLITNLGVSDIVVFTGFIHDEELAAHFSIANIYVMPSMKEGFGIVFNEAMFYGLPVIAGNRDGSVDALLNGTLGLLVDPLRVDELTDAILKIISNTSNYIPNRQTLLDHFSYDQYKKKLEDLINKRRINACVDSK